MAELSGGLGWSSRERDGEGKNVFVHGLNRAREFKNCRKDKTSCKNTLMKHRFLGLDAFSTWILSVLVEKIYFSHPH